MTIPRLYLPRPLERGAVCAAAADQARYLKTVLRMREGDSLLIFNGTDWEYEAVIRRRTADGMELEITGRHRLPAAEIHVTLCQAVPKVEKMEGIIRHATELGAERIVPFLAERSVPAGSRNSFRARGRGGRRSPSKLPASAAGPTSRRLGRS